MPPVDPQRDAQTAEAFRLRELDGLPIRDIADRLGIAPSTVVERLSRAEDIAGRVTVTGGAALRRRLMAELGGWTVRLDREYAAGKVEITSAIRAAVALSGQLAALGGAFAPRRIDVTEAPAAPVLDPDMTAAIQGALAELDAADRRNGHGTEPERGAA